MSKVEAFSVSKFLRSDQQVGLPPSPTLHTFLEAVDSYLVVLKFVPDWFVTREMIKNLIILHFIMMNNDDE